MPRVAVLVAVGFVAGLGSGLLGVGGGIVMVPGLVLAAGFAQRDAHATSLAAIVPIGVVGAALFVAGGEIDPGVAVALAAGSLAGVPFGVRSLSRIPEPALRAIFAAVALASGVRLLIA